MAEKVILSQISEKTQQQATKSTQEISKKNPIEHVVNQYILDNKS